MKAKKTLYFVAGQPSDEQKALAEKNGLSIRNSAAYKKGDFKEACDMVAGDAPDIYKDVERHDADKDAQALLKEDSKKPAAKTTAKADEK